MKIKQKGTTLLVIIIILVILGFIAYFIYLFFITPTFDDSHMVPTTTLTPTKIPNNQIDRNIPQVVTPLRNSIVTSPLTVKGTVPPGWMFEGQLMLKLLDSNKNSIVQGTGHEVSPGSWTSEKPVEFKGKMEFTTISKNGFLIIEADNPSGLPENSKSFEIPIKF